MGSVSWPFPSASTGSTWDAWTIFTRPSATSPKGCSNDACRRRRSRLRRSHARRDSRQEGLHRIRRRPRATRGRGAGRQSPAHLRAGRRGSVARVAVRALGGAGWAERASGSHTARISSSGNELALLAERAHLDPLEVIRAANLDYPRPDLSKPGYVGGGCLSKDPYILLASGQALGHEPWLVGRARALNEYVPGHVARRFLTLLTAARGGLDGARVALLGFAYKGWPPTDDMRGAPVLAMLEVFREARLTLAGHDFLVAPQIIRDLGVEPRPLEHVFDGADGVLVVTDHPEYAKLDLGAALAQLRRPALVYDSWRILDEAAVRAAGIRYAAIGYA